MPFVRLAVAPWLSTWLAAHIISCEACGVDPDWDELEDAITAAVELAL